MSGFRYWKPEMENKKKEDESKETKDANKMKDDYCIIIVYDVDDCMGIFEKELFLKEKQIESIVRIGDGTIYKLITCSGKEYEIKKENALELQRELLNNKSDETFLQCCGNCLHDTSIQHEKHFYCRKQQPHGCCPSWAADTFKKNNRLELCE